MNFGLLNEGKRDVWFTGGMYTLILFYWSKVHVSFSLLEEGTREVWFI